MKHASIRPHTNHSRPRPLLILLFGFLTLLGGLSYVSGISPRSGFNLLQLWFSSEEDDDFGKDSFPDFQMYSQRVKVLGTKDIPLDDPNRRVIVVGDIHGMNDSFHSLLDQLSFSASNDIIVHVGDVLSKGPHRSSMSTLEFMTQHNILGVRGNHDQQVIEWRAWMNWIRSSSEGARWLDAIDQRWEDVHKLGKDTKKWLRKEIEKIPNRWVRRIPKGWKLFGDHYRIARQLNEQEWQYLKNLPMLLHIPHAHAYIVHAGLLPYDPRYGHDHRKQPLTRLPQFVRPPTENDFRFAQETAILGDIKPNRDPWSLSNMRAILQGVVTRQNRGVFWAKIWNREMKQCRGFDGNRNLYCLGSTVIYGHTAKRGFEARRWTVGLDSGCVYGKRLTALVLGGDHVGRTYSEHPEHDDAPWNDDEDEQELESQPKLDLVADNHDEDVQGLRLETVRFGDRGVATVASIKCLKP